jgi:hypothetical protein
MYNYYYKNYWITAIQEPNFCYSITPLSNHYRYLYVEESIGTGSFHNEEK